MAAASSGVRELIEAHYDQLFRYAYRLTGSAADAEDLTQDTFSKALLRLSQLREPDKAKGWLFRILRNAYLHRIRDQKRHHTISLESVGDLPEVTSNHSSNSSLDIDPAHLQEVLNELDESFRTPLILFYFEDFSYRDIADQMELPMGTVMSRLARAKSYLRHRLDPNSDQKVDGPRRASDGL